MTAVPCRDCGSPQSTDAPTCRICGSAWQAFRMTVLGLVVSAVLVALFVLVVLWWLT